MAEYEFPPTNGHSKDHQMPHTQNGQTGRKQSFLEASPVQINVTGWKMFNMMLSAVLFLLYGGWFILPAKDSDLKLLQKEVVGLREDLQTMTLDMRGIRSDLIQARMEIIRLGGYADAQASAPQQPVVTRKRRAPIQAGTVERH